MLDRLKSRLNRANLKDYIGRYIIYILLLIPIYTPNTMAQTMDLSKAIIHHTASHDVSAKTIDTWHKERGWDGIGYHFVIRKDGSIEKGRDINKIGAHAKGRNNYIGIVLTGYDEFTEEQKLSLIQLLLDLKVSYIERHHEECPGSGINIEKIQKLIGG